LTPKGNRLHIGIDIIYGGEKKGYTDYPVDGELERA
jgi:hypothetical protein